MNQEGSVCVESTEPGAMRARKDRVIETRYTRTEMVKVESKSRNTKKALCSLHK